MKGYFATAPESVPPRCTTFRVNLLDGLEKRCSSCHDWWPADTDFFTRHEIRPGGLANQCKACAAAAQAASRGSVTRPSTTPPVELLASVAWLGTRPTRSVGAGAKS